MVDKLHEYQGIAGRFHTWRDEVKEWRTNFLQSDNNHVTSLLSASGRHRPPQTPEDVDKIEEHDYSHIYRKKTRWELIRVSAAVMGIEFAYAAETAFVSPTLLKIGVQHEHMTLVWALSPLIGFFITPLLGSISDRCRSKWGRRRPFIVLLALGVFLGLILVPNGEDLGHAMGDFYPSRDLPQHDATLIASLNNETSTTEAPLVADAEYAHPWGVFFTILGTALLDFDADACQSPARAYLLDVTVPDDHAKGLSTFTIMAGMGGFLGYALGGIDWDETAIGVLLGGHVRAVFTLITFIFVLCVTYTVTSFKEIPLDVLKQEGADIQNGVCTKIRDEQEHSYGTVTASNHLAAPIQDGLKDCCPINEDGVSQADKCYLNLGIEEKDRRQNVLETSFIKPAIPGEDNGIDYEAVNHQLKCEPEAVASLGQYLLSIVYMPKSLRILCLTNLFCWMAHVCYSLYFTDFVGEAVFKGDPKAAEGSESKQLYEEGVRFGCWGMSMYSLSCACYSSIIELLIKRLRARNVYVGGLVIYSTGMLLMALTQNRFGVIVFSWTAGIMYSTLFTMPYLLIAHYHASDTFEATTDGHGKVGTQLRGLGTDVAILSSMVFLAQFILSMFMGSIVSAVGSTVAVIAIASFLAFCGAITANFVMYLDL